MRIILTFSNDDKKSQIIAPFLAMENCQANDNQLIVPGIIKILFDNNQIKCYCLGISVVEKILSNICTIEVSSNNNNGLITFPKSLNGAMMECKILNFKNVMDLCSNGNVLYVNTDNKKLKAIVPLSQWLNANLIIDNEDAFINLEFKDYEINVTDGSAVKFCERVKEHPLISASSLSKYFDFGTSIELTPSLEYMCLWKILKSENGYKKYSNFINECNDKINIEYDEGKKYRCEFNGGKIDFQLLSIGDKYPKKVVLQIHELKEIDILESLKKNLNFNTIDLMAKIINLKLTTHQLLKELNFYKEEDFFIFVNTIDNFKATYDIANNTMIIKQEFKITNIDEDYLKDSFEYMKKWINKVIKSK